MMNHYDKEAVKHLSKGVEEVYRAVSATMGPFGKNVVFPPNNITHDGVTVARNVNLPYPESVGANLLKDASERLDSELGDGTTTTAVLAHGIVKEGRKHEPMRARRELHAALPGLFKQLESLKIEGGVEDAAIIAAGSRELGELVNEATLQTEGGHISIDKAEKSRYEIIPGYIIPLPYLTPAQHRKVEIKDPLVFICKKSVTSNDEAIAMMNLAKTAGKKNILLMAPAIREDAFQTLMLNTAKGNIGCLMVEVPRNFIDIAVYTGAKVTEDLSKVTEEDAGSCDKVVSDHEETTIIGQHGDKKAVEEHIETVKDEKLRVSMLRGKTAVIYVGGFSQGEIQDKMYRVEDAIGAARAAYKNGVIPGMGIPLYNLDLSDCGPVAKKILKHALKQPYIKLMKNSERKPKRKPELIDLLNGKLSHKVVDPLDITKEALAAAVSVGGNILTAGAILSEPPKQPQEYAKVEKQ